ncbi:phospholipase D-like domain-containing protein [Caulobacter segnis]
MTPRYFDGHSALLALDPDRTVVVTLDVGPFAVSRLRVGFTRGFVQSQAYIRRFGSKIPSRPKGGALNFNTQAIGGKTPQGETFTYAQQYAWLGFSARNMVFDVLQEVLEDDSLTLDVFAYDLNEPDVINAFLEPGAQGRLRIILDDASLHHDAAAPPPEDEFEAMLKAAAPGRTICLRGNFDRFAHDKVFIVRTRADNKAVRVLTGSTNLSVTGLYVNSNHVLVFDDAGVAGLYAQKFDTVWRDEVKAEPFRSNDLANTIYRFGAAQHLPTTEISFSPHHDDVALRGLNAMVGRILEEPLVADGLGSVLFAVMGLEGGKVNPVYDALNAVHKNTKLFSYGVSDDPGGIAYYPVGAQTGVLVTGKPAKSRLPKPFSQVPSLGFGHQIHHQVCGVRLQWLRPGSLLRLFEPGLCRRNRERRQLVWPSATPMWRRPSP